jgi:tetratricopeptide (TPR) repeat protein
MPGTQVTDKLWLKILSFLPAELPVTDLADERFLLERLAGSSHRDPVEIFWQLIHFYRAAEKNDLACKLINHMLEADDSAESQAHCYLVLGQIAEAGNQLDAAIDFYMRGLAFRTPDKAVQYSLYNNTAYCLVLQKKCLAAESYCRSAIEIDSKRANAFKTLGLSLAGQDNFVGAAWAYVEATVADARDPRALQLFKQLVVDHPHLASQFTLLLNAYEREQTKGN